MARPLGGVEEHAIAVDEDGIRPVVDDLEPEDLRALTLEASAITGLPLVGTRWVPGRGKDL